ncbi:MAG TPA: glutamine-hydrolyzing carbamoyl-phosphate synthase small subunit [Flavobacteriales bacterium]|nr:glutamine-hydrolyzing carbamoyl-phosphate synthase small subunit [Flavobacteriales bacterium]
MKYLTPKPAVLVLQDGTVFHGHACGAIGTATGEIAFNTGMTGYQEIFTDPSYYGQVAIMATAHIGNYGTHPEEIESETIKIAGLICKKFSSFASRYGKDIVSLQKYFERDNKVGICDVDTRMLVRTVRQKGAMNCIISSENLNVEELKKQLEKVPSMDGLELSSKVTTRDAYFAGDETSDYKVALIDFGVKRNIIRCLTERGAYVKVFPMDTTLEEIVDWDPDGILLSNGPGDPSVMAGSIDLVKRIVATNIPVFGICLGHQILALSQGLKTEKMHNGHRGINHPIKNLVTGKCEITSQNHGFVVSAQSVSANAEIEVTHVHLNDKTVAGIRLKNKKVFSVQYHPEASPGPHDSRYLFDQFLENIKQGKKDLIQA